MALYPDYASLEDIKSLLGVEDTVDDDAISVAITAASRSIDHHCQRQFGSALAQVREYPIAGRTVAIEDVQSVSLVAVRPKWGSDLVELDAGVHYQLLPLNAAAKGRPFTHVELPLDYDRSWVLRVTGTVGWASIPLTVTQACQIQAIRLFKRKDSPFGVTGSPEMQGEMRLLARVDPDVAVLLAQFRRSWGAV